MKPHKNIKIKYVAYLSESWWQMMEALDFVYQMV